jgi:uncharacterized protein (DUF433 family)/DNA-binding transcriptional MerR regulator
MSSRNVLDASGKFLGKGLYSVPFAARLTGVSESKIRRWLFGSSKRKSLLTPEFETSDSRVLSFLDLIEVMLVAAFRDQGVSFQHIRKVAEKATRELDTVHPFAHKKFITDGRRIFVEELENDKAQLSDFLRDQREFREFVEQSLHRGVEFDVGNIAMRWRPNPTWPAIVIDPARSFGQPIVDRTRTPTSTLYRSYLGTGSLEEAAATYEVLLDEARQAVAFEQSIEEAQAA